MGDTIRVLDCDKHKEVKLTKKCVFCAIEAKAKLERTREIIGLLLPWSHKVDKAIEIIETTYEEELKGGEDE